MLAYHFLRDDMAAGSGKEPAWAVGEERVCKGCLELCANGYHYGTTWYDALRYAPGPIACIVDVDEPQTDDQHDGGKGVSQRRKLLVAVNVERELRLFGCDCAERALLRERDRGREPDKRCWDAITVARRYADGQASRQELSAAAAAAAWAAARAAARAAAEEARAAEEEEIKWQRRRLDEILNIVRLPEEVPA